MSAPKRLCTLAKDICYRMGEPINKVGVATEKERRETGRRKRKTECVKVCVCLWKNPSSWRRCLSDSVVEGEGESLL